MATAETGDEVSIQYVGECRESNCSFEVDVADEAVAHRTAGRHEGANDLQHKIDLRVVINE